ncbi:hypothetical protein DFH08DRAFT_935018 [Mycena albidolilacea]|uniref:Uncharacterized protein n=1 Tax=Mycena albidolilacea TaxID=1033008 RepID=A0AAD7A7C8_9AGAR|nr:hypothetical protein DFH08DRAFT_935018 [Mycena albidolilacea]
MVCRSTADRALSERPHVGQCMYRHLDELEDEACADVVLVAQQDAVRQVHELAKGEMDKHRLCTDYIVLALVSALFDSCRHREEAGAFTFGAENSSVVDVHRGIVCEDHYEWGGMAVSQREWGREGEGWCLFGRGMVFSFAEARLAAEAVGRGAMRIRVSLEDQTNFYNSIAFHYCIQKPFQKKMEKIMLYVGRENFGTVRCTFNEGVDLIIQVMRTMDKQVFEENYGSKALDGLPSTAQRCQVQPTKGFLLNAYMLEYICESTILYYFIQFKYARDF